MYYFPSFGHLDTWLTPVKISQSLMCSIAQNNSSTITWLVRWLSVTNSNYIICPLPYKSVRFHLRKDGSLMTGLRSDKSRDLSQLVLVEISISNDREAMEQESGLWITDEFITNHQNWQIDWCYKFNMQSKKYSVLDCNKINYTTLISHLIFNTQPECDDVLQEKKRQCDLKWNFILCSFKS